MTKTLLFMCPHNAAKSTLAVAYAHRKLSRKNISEFKVSSAGTDPDEQVSSAVLQFLKNEGFGNEIQAPRMVTEEDLSSAHKIISLGCDPETFNSYEDKVLNWDDVPSPSQDLKKSVDKISEKIDQLVLS